MTNYRIFCKKRFHFRCKKWFHASRATEYLQMCAYRSDSSTHALGQPSEVKLGSIPTIDPRDQLCLPTTLLPGAMRRVTNKATMSKQRCIDARFGTIPKYPFCWEFDGKYFSSFGSAVGFNEIVAIVTARVLNNK